MIRLRYLVLYGTVPVNQTKTTQKPMMMLCKIQLDSTGTVQNQGRLFFRSDFRSVQISEVSGTLAKTYSGRYRTGRNPPRHTIF